MAEDRVDIFGKRGKLTPEEVQRIQLETPAFKRAKKGQALDELRNDMRDSSKSGGTRAETLDPINYANKDKGVPTSKMTPSDINPASKSEN